MLRSLSPVIVFGHLGYGFYVALDLRCHIIFTVQYVQQSR